jgi:hypothetical protein
MKVGQMEHKTVAKMEILMVALMDEEKVEMKVGQMVAMLVW